MGQAASMCRFRGCRYKKNKNDKTTTSATTTTTTTTTIVTSSIITTTTATITTTALACTTTNLTTTASNGSPGSGLHFRSIEEPPNIGASGIGLNSTSSVHHQHRMPIEQGGTGYGSESSLRAGVPLSLQNSTSSLASGTLTAVGNAQHSLYATTTTTHSLQQKGYDPEHARMEAWMDENQEFVHDYFIRKATRQTVDTWLVSHATTAGNDVVTSASSPTHTNGQNCSSRGGSGATTPVRKISAHEFERGGLLKPIVNTIDGTPTFLSIGTQNDCSANSNNNAGYMGPSGVGHSGNNNQAGSTGSSNNYHNHHNYNHHHHHHHHQRPQRLSRNELKQLDEKELIFELVKDICNELEVRSLCHKILQNVSILLNADRGSLFLVQGRCNGADGPKKCLVSKLFDVCPRSTFEEMKQQNEVRVAWGSGIAGYVAESGEPVNIPDAYQDKRFTGEIDSLTGYRTKTLLCMPIKDSSGDVIGVAQVINKLNGECFTETDEKVFASYLQFCGIGLRNAQLYEKSQLEIKRNQVLLDLARMIFEEQSTIEHMVFRILTHMQSLIQCQRVQILLVHEATKGSFSRVFDFEANDLSQEDNTLRTSPYESRFPINVGITGYVATTGETVNIPNAYEDNRFDPSVDENCSFKHKSILCMAIKNSLGQIIGVIQLINKFDDLIFTKNDENFVEAFAIFCGMGIHNTHMYEKAIVAMAKQSVTLEVLSYHASATIDEAHRLRRLRVPSAVHFRLHDFKFDDITYDDDDTLKACLRMFLDLDFVERFHIDYEVLCRWLLSVKKNYRNVTYHNWRHAFNVAQMMFAILTATQWWKIFGEIECLALIIGCLCHDLDHRGTNNSFQIKASSPLAQLYSTSTMEHHHFDQCLMILNSPGNQILGNLSSEDYCRVIRVLEDAILSTDLAVYLRKRGPFLQSVKEKPSSYWIDEEPRALLRAMSMTVCDLSAITKPWEIEKRVADLVSSEFFEQGDMEKQELNITPIDIMNREKEDELPKMQVGFIDDLCLPIYEAFANLSDKLEPLVEGVRDNRRHWIDLAEGVEQEISCEATKCKSKDHCNEMNGDLKKNSSSLTNNDNDDSENDDEDDVHSSHTLLITECNSPNDDAHDDDADEVIVCNEKCNLKDIKNNNCNERYLKLANENEIKTSVDVHGNNDDDDVENDDSDVEIYHSSSCHSSGSSRLSTPPPTGDDESVPMSPEINAQAKLNTDSLNHLNEKSLKLHNNTCKSCDYMRCYGSVRKASSLKGANEWEPQVSRPNGWHSKSVPTMSGCGMNAAAQSHHHSHTHRSSNGSSSSSSSKHNDHHHNQQQHTSHYAVIGHPHHCHPHHYNHHHSHHHHYNHHHQHQHQHTAGGNSISASSNESDKIPKIVGKLGNLDTMQLLASAAASCSTDVIHHTNGIGFGSNGLSYLPTNLLTATPSRHSETNRPSTTTKIMPATINSTTPTVTTAVNATSMPISTSISTTTLMSSAQTAATNM